MKSQLQTSYSMLDVLLFRARNVRVTNYSRSKDCKRATMRHFWDHGTFPSWFFAWRTNPCGTQSCGCVFQYGQV